MSNSVVSVTCVVQAHQISGHFSVPKAALDALELGDGDVVHLHVSCGTASFQLTIPMKSGTEVYPRSGLAGSDQLKAIEPKERIFVTVSRP